MSEKTYLQSSSLKESRRNPNTTSCCRPSWLGFWHRMRRSHRGPRLGCEGSGSSPSPTIPDPGTGRQETVKEERGCRVGLAIR